MRLLQRAFPIPFTQDQIQQHIEWGLAHGFSEAETRADITQTENAEMWKNDQYIVTVTRESLNGVIHLSIRRLDNGPARDWRDFQMIKNQLVGSEHEGVELYPAEDRVVDVANQFHLWVFANPAYRCPFGFPSGCKSSDETGGIKQRAHAAPNPYLNAEMWLLSRNRDPMPDLVWDEVCKALEAGYALRHPDGKVEMTGKYYQAFGGSRPESTTPAKLLLQQNLEEGMKFRVSPYRVVSAEEWDEPVSIPDGWCILRNDPEATDGEDELSAVVSTEAMADAFCAVLNQTTGTQAPT